MALAAGCSPRLARGAKALYEGLVLHNKPTPSGPQNLLTELEGVNGDGRDS